MRDSLADKQTRIVETNEATSGDSRARAKNSTRTETRSGQAALLGKAIQAAVAICKLKGQYPEAPQADGGEPRALARGDGIATAVSSSAAANCGTRPGKATR